MDHDIKLYAPLPAVLHEAGGEYRLRGHRITLYHVVSAYEERAIGPEAMVFYFPSLSYDEVRAVFDFIRANRAAVEDYRVRYKAALDAMYASLEPGTSMAVLRERFERMRQEKSTPAPAE